MAEELSLAEELSRGFDEPESTVADAPVVDGGGDSVSAPAPEQTAPADPAEPTGERQRGPDGKFLKATATPKPEPVGQPPVVDPAKPEGQEVQTENNVIDLAPSTFTPAAKAAYQALPKDSPLRADIKKREGDYQKGISQYKQAAEQGNSLMAEIQPYMGIIQAEGGTPQRAIKQLLHTAYQLRSGTPQQKAQLVLQIAQQYGADMSSLQRPAPTDGQQPHFDPQTIAPVVQQLLTPHLQRMEQFQNQLLTAQQQQEQQAANEVNASVEAFRLAADANGNPKHPYFDDVREWMGSFIGSGHAKTMDEAYEMACRAHPEVSRVIASAQTQSQEAQRLAEAKRKAEEARRSSAVNVTGQGGVGTADITSQSLTDELSAGYDRMVGGARV